MYHFITDLSSDDFLEEESTILFIDYIGLYDLIMSERIIIFRSFVPETLEESLIIIFRSFLKNNIYFYI